MGVELGKGTMSITAPVRSRQSYRHEAFLWHGRDQFVQRLAPFIQQGLDAGEAVMVAVTPEHARWLCCHLGSRASEVRFVDMTKLGRNPACIIPAWHAFLAGSSGSGRPARGIGEPIWVGRRPEEIVECQLHEALLNLAVDPDLPFWLVCPYDDEQLDPGVIAEAGRSHPVLATTTTFMGSPSYQGHAHARALFTADLPPPTEPPTHTRVIPSQELETLAAYVTLQATAANLWSHEVVSLTRNVHGLTKSSVRRGAREVQIQLFEARNVLICDVIDDTVIEDLLIGRRSGPADDDSLWFANHTCHLVQARSSDNGTTVRLHVRR